MAADRTGGCRQRSFKRHTGSYVWDVPDVDAHTHTLAEVTDAGSAAVHGAAPG
ncbi:MAG: hypothetical protein H7A46_21570 [Verrucomicrobiales bacterium]|nr:hypothetical protein [Verrucomicrobiales bacterium]MCP5524136.1 hypothetical protein [Verrucomicrobiales bacterium]